MAAMIKFPLKMTDGTQVKTIEELREHFNLADVLRYYDDGRLCKWLRAWYYDDEAEKVGQLDSHSGDFKKKICDILGVPYLESEAKRIEIDSVVKNNKRREHLKKYTADDKILAAIDRVAFTQEELDRLLEEGCKDIYLCGNQFTISGNIGGIKYTGINELKVELNGKIAEMGIEFQNLTVNIDKYIAFDGEEPEPFFSFFDKNRKLGIKLLWASVEEGSVSAQVVLGKCYAKGFGVWEDYDEAVRWYRKAVDQSFTDAVTNLANKFADGLFGVEQQDQKASIEQGAADLANSFAGLLLSTMGQKDEESFNLLLAAVMGEREKQYLVGKILLDKKYEILVAQHKKIAIVFLQQAAAQGHILAGIELVKIAPKLSKLSDVIICATGNQIGMMLTAILDKMTGNIIIAACDQDVNVDIIKEFGATRVWTEPLYVDEENFNHPALVDWEAYNIYENDKVQLFGFINETKPEPRKANVWVCIELEKISSDMEDDFNSYVKPLCYLKADRIK